MCKDVNWLDKLKIAVLNQNETDIISLLDSMPKFDDNNDLITARVLIGEVINILQQNKDKLSCNMNKVKQIKAFLEI